MRMHLRDIELIELAGGQLPAAEDARARAHLAACVACAERYERTRQTWDLLGHWKLSEEAPRRMRLASPPARATPPANTTSRMRLAGALRIAAAIALAAGVGAMAGWYGSPAGMQQRAMEPVNWTDPTPWQVWHEPTPARLADPMLSLVLEADEEVPS